MYSIDLNIEEKCTGFQFDDNQQKLKGKVLSFSSGDKIIKEMVEEQQQNPQPIVILSNGQKVTTGYAGFDEIAIAGSLDVHMIEEVFDEEEGFPVWLVIVLIILVCLLLALILLVLMAIKKKGKKEAEDATARLEREVEIAENMKMIDKMGQSRDKNVVSPSTKGDMASFRNTNNFSSRSHVNQVIPVDLSALAKAEDPVKANFSPDTHKQGSSLKYEELEAPTTPFVKSDKHDNDLMSTAPRNSS